MRSREKPNPTHAFPKHHDQSSHVSSSHVIKLQTLRTLVFYSFSFPLQPLPFFLPSIISSTVFKQTVVSFHNFSTTKKKQMQMHMQKPKVDLQPFFHSLLFFFFFTCFLFFIFLGRSDVGDYFKQCFVIFQEPSDLCPVLKTGQFDRCSKG